MRYTFEMPEVTSCAADGCVYNSNGMCHARAITMGDETGNRCDTMMICSSGSLRRGSAGVAACRASDCKYNQDFECVTAAIDVGFTDGQAECMTFSPG